MTRHVSQAWKRAAWSNDENVTSRERAKARRSASVLMVRHVKWCHNEATGRRDRASGYTGASGYIGTGVVVLLPAVLPYALLPQHRTVASFIRAHVCSSPAETWVTPERPGIGVVSLLPPV